SNRKGVRGFHEDSFSRQLDCTKIAGEPVYHRRSHLCMRPPSNTKAQNKDMHKCCPPQRGHPNSILVNIPLGRPREAVHCFPRISLASAVCGSRASDLPLHVRLFIHDTDQDQFPEPSAPRLKSKEPLGPT